MSGITFTSTLFSDSDYDAPMKTCVYGYDCDMYFIRRKNIDYYRKTLSAKTKSGVYCLIGGDEHEPCVYIGQAGLRADYGGIMDRICCEHNRPSENYWHTALVFSMRVDDFEPTELNYMENSLTKKAEEGHKYKVINKVMPSTGYMRYYDEMSNRLDRFLNMGILIMNSTTPYRVFNVKNMELSTHANATLAPNADTIKKKRSERRLFTTNNGTATCTIESSTHVTLLRGSAIRRNSSKRNHDRIERIRLPHKALISSTGNLRQDIVFSSLSRASSFVLGYLCNGQDYWKDADGKTYREVLSSK